MATITKEARMKYNKTAYAKHKAKHNETCKNYYIENSELLRKKRIERYYIQKKVKLESPEYKLKIEAKKEIKRQKLLQQLKHLD